MRYYSTLRPIGPGCLPSKLNIIKVVNFDTRKLVKDQGINAWGYVDIYGEIPNYGDYDLVQGKPKYRRPLRPGDCVQVGSSSAIVGEILSQDIYNDDFDPDRSYAFVEFTDMYGKYHSYKSTQDGGKVVYSDDNNLGSLYPMLSKEASRGIFHIVGYLKSLGVDFKGSIVYFKFHRVSEGRSVWRLFRNSEDLGYVNLNDPNDTPEIREALLNIVKEQPDVRFIFLLPL